jgi:ligand-binding sensor domain-containing protein
MNKYFPQPPVLALLATLLFNASCNGQVQSTFVTKPSPTIIKNFKSAALAPDFDTTLVSQYIRSIFQDSKGNLWFGTIAEGVVRYDEKTLTYFSNPDGFVQQTVYAINEDKQGNMWFGTDEGVYKYNGKEFRKFNQKDGLNHLDITRKGILVDKSGAIWVGTHGGLYKYDPVSEATGFPSFAMPPDFPKMNVAGMMQDRIGHIWIVTSDKGVFCYDGKKLTHITDKVGFGDNYAGGLAQDKAGNLWFTMKNGICKYDGKIFTEYTAKDGLGGTEFWGLIIEKSGII